MARMYLARETIDGTVHYFIRESYPDGTCYRSRNLFDLGRDPRAFIVYPGGHGYYYAEVIEEALAAQGVRPDTDELDAVFWDFLDPEIRRVIDAFQRRGSAPRRPPAATADIHRFDKRRLHYLKFGRPHPVHIDRLASPLFDVCRQKSRDEIEQYFLSEELRLRPAERVHYVHVIFDLHTASVSGDLGDPALLDTAFEAAVCRLHDDARFWDGMPAAAGLPAPLVRYVITYFDEALGRPAPLQADFEAFVNRRRTYQPPPAVRVKMEEASRLFEVPWKELKAMNRKAFTRLYRRQALKHHPDQGGSARRFARLSAVYRALLARKRG